MFVVVGCNLCHVMFVVVGCNLCYVIFVVVGCNLPGGRYSTTLQLLLEELRSGNLDTCLEFERVSATIHLYNVHSAQRRVSVLIPPAYGEILLSLA